MLDVRWRGDLACARVEFLERKYFLTAFSHLIDRFGLELIRKTFAGQIARLFIPRSFLPADRESSN